MKLKLFLLTANICAILFFVSSELSAQCTPKNISINWSFISDIDHGDDIAWDIVPIDDDDPDPIKNDGFIVVGETYSSDSLKRQAVIMRISPDGNLVWKVVRGGNQNDVISAVDQSSNGNVIMAGSTKSKKFGGKLNANVWFFEYTLNGELVEGSENEYGGSGNENGYDIKLDPNTGNYVIVGGTGSEADGDLSDHSASGINASGEYWILVIDPNDYHIVWENIYHGDYENPNGRETDFARGVLVDHKGNYVVSGYCTSCGADHTQMQSMVVRVENNGNLIWKKNYGDQSNNNARDQGSHGVVEVYDPVLESNTYLLPGVNHPTNCFDSHNHDMYALKLAKNGKNIWTGGCETDDGFTYGGSKKEDGLSAVETCDGGYLIVGDESSSSNDYDITCNHSDVNTSDAWILKINSEGEKEWDESLGDVNNDEAHSVKRMLDGSYVIAGEYGSGTKNGQDFYVVSFELTSCSPPTGLKAVSNGCEATLSWNTSSCVAAYALKYKETSASSFTTVYPAVSPYLITGSPGGSDKYKWSVQARCSQNKASDVAQGPGFVLQACKFSNEVLNDEDAENLISVYPNPSAGKVHLSFQLNSDISSTATVEVLDQVGKIVSSSDATIEKGHFNHQLNFEGLPSGFYWIRMNVEGKTYQTKLVLQKS